ncbi:hypothetical protein CEXT_125021 [Caerostris extrusa]|uniref:Uncharacterized protein n=1 Tax=Caerostris extrusa TaxID=172846 RepID=A0AAV4Y7U7_CAEEX|nr:hypothetical protein CEXT_125021 [Caerostris extrusa]
MIHGMDRQIFEDGYPLRLILRPQQIPLKIALQYSTHPNETLTHRTNFLAGPAVYWQWPKESSVICSPVKQHNDNRLQLMSSNRACSLTGERRVQRQMAEDCALSYYAHSSTLLFA